MAAKTGTFSAHFGNVWIGAFLALAAKASANRYPKQEEEDNISRPENHRYSFSAGQFIHGAKVGGTVRRRCIIYRDFRRSSFCTYGACEPEGGANISLKAPLLLRYFHRCGMQISSASASDPSRRERASAVERLPRLPMDTPDAAVSIEPHSDVRPISRAPPPVHGALQSCRLCS